MNMGYLLIEKSKPVVKQIYSLTLDLPKIHQFSIGEQLRRSSLSIVLNITEAGARKGIGEKRQLLNIAFGSLKETMFIIGFMYEIGLIDDSKHKDLMSKLDELSRILYSIIYK